MPITTPTKIVDAFGHNASGAQITNPIPETTSTPGAASFDQGFPADTMTAPTAGGIPPFGQDVNGILYMSTAVESFLNAGQLFPYDGTFASAIGGYALGAFVANAAGNGLWQCTSAGNTSNPDTGGAGWVPVSTTGPAVITTSGGSTALTAPQWAKPIIIIEGALTSNASIVFPALTVEWLVINATSGAYTVTATCAGGTGVAIPAGGFAQPTGVYSDGANMQYAFSPLTVAISQSPTPSTIVERDSAGNGAFVRVNSDAGIETVATIGGVVVQNAALDGFYRTVDVNSFIQQFFVNGKGVLAANQGSWSFPGGPTIKWGQNAGSGGGVTVTFAAAFPVACYAVVACNTGASGAFNAIGTKTAANFVLYQGSGAGPAFWIAIGS